MCKNEVKYVKNWANQLFFRFFCIFSRGCLLFSLPYFSPNRVKRLAAYAFEIHAHLSIKTEMLFFFSPQLLS